MEGKIMILPRMILPKAVLFTTAMLQRAQKK